MLSNRSIPRATVIPTLAYPDVNQAAAWLCNAFGFLSTSFTQAASCSYDDDGLSCKVTAHRKCTPIAYSCLLIAQ